MRRFMAATLLGLAIAGPAAAQFEGTITMKMATPAAGGDMTMKIAMKGNKSATLMTMPASAGPMAGMEMRSIYDPTTNTMTTLMPMLPQMAAMPGMANAKGMKNVMDMSKVQASGAAQAQEGDVTVKKLGTSETILGMSCDDYEMTSSKGEPTRLCVTSALGPFVFPQTGSPMGGRRGGGGQSAPAWTKAFGNKPMFPLKVWTTDGKMAMEVTAIDKGTVPSSMFDIPDGYVDLAAMMGGMRPPM